MQLKFFRLLFALLDALSPRLAARLAVSVFYTPRRYPAAKWESTASASGKPDSLRFDGEHLDATIWEGKGPTVLLVHGWQGRRGQLGKIALELLDRGYRVVTFDGPAHGSSAKKRTTLVEFSEAVEHAARGYGPLHGIVGHSFGAAAVAIAMRKGVQAQRAVLISCPFSLRHVVGGFARFVRLPGRSHEKMYPIMQGLHHCAETELSFDTIGPDLRTPCLLIHDESDKYIPITDGEKVTRSIAGAELVRTRTLGHMRILQDERVVQRVADFVAQPVCQTS
ncbi:MULTISPECIES: alpha/beta hydrolase [unclassified Paraburkholderia]|uniref:alpha/beta hydrolase n=1 Tax=unclassified Paraburkholderia TaxID=2615204 RepID=UPI0016218067|nr:MULTISPECIES: alpha/beta hydrolase [unclassified Paraburkholderia]MBB5447920.1 pimeloyl-ACP methyl ester carboxylesterase [Paraburkholderia sp. WSM4177]MBB5488300.1 pimeloyl-ACP methyl ester carboxylesterase [Paraburkholderia sp. WSM4180]